MHQLQDLLRDLHRQFAVAKLRAIQETLTRDDGQGIAEYVIILAVVIVAAIALVLTFSGEISALWGSVITELGSI